MERRATKAPASGPRHVDLPPLSVRAGVSSIDEEARTVDVVLTTTTPVERYDWETGKRYLEKLSMDPAHVDIRRLNDGGPLLDSHSSYSVRDQLGAVVPGSVAIVKNELRATVRFSRRADVDGVWQDVRDGLVNSLSIGYRVHKYEKQEGKGNALPVMTATRWEVYEASMVSIPADAGAKVREGTADTNSCEVVPAAPAVEAEPAPPAEEEKQPMEQQTAASVVADLTLDTTTTPAPAKTEPTEGDVARAAETARVQGIIMACRNARMPQKMTDELIAAGTSLVDAQSRVFAEMGRRDNGRAEQVPAGGPSGRVEITGDDPAIVQRDGIVEALCHRAHPRQTVKQQGESREIGFALTDKARPFMGLSLLRIAERLLLARGHNVNRLSDVQIAEMAFRSGGMHSTSDFPLLLADVANKTLRAGYEEAPQTFGPITRLVTVPDFKQVKRTQFGEAPQLAEVNEHGEITSGTIAEGREVYSVSTYGKIFSVTRKAIVNDDLNAFTRVPMAMGQQARNKESDLVWAQITSNPAMGDGENLFSNAHANWDNSGAAIDVDSIGIGRAAMRVQTGLDGATLLNITPRFLIVPAALETKADQFVSQALLANQPGQVNPFAGRLSVVSEARLDAASTIIWYLAASIAEFGDIIELATLEGSAGPRLEQKLGFEIEGVSFKVVHDIGAKVIDHRGLYRNAGVALT